MKTAPFFFLKIYFFAISTVFSKSRKGSETSSLEQIGP